MESWFPVLTLVLGVSLKAVFDLLSSSSKARIDKAVRVELRKEKILMQRIDLQRLALVDLQTALADVMRAAGTQYLFDLREQRNTGSWGKGLMADTESESDRLAFRAVTLAKVRVHSSEVRNIAEQLISACASVGHAESMEEAKDWMTVSGNLFERANEIVGAELRQLQDEEQALLI